MSIREEIKLTVLEFGRSLREKEAFAGEITKFKLAFKSQVVKVLSLSAGEDLRDRLMEEVIGGVEEALSELEKDFGKGDEELLSRQALFLESLNGLLKDFLTDEALGDKRALSQLTARISHLLEGINLEIKERRGGFIKKLRGFLFGG